KSGASGSAGIGVGVLKERIAEVCIRRCAGAFTGGPAIVRSSYSVIDFLPCALSDIVDKHPAGSRLETERKRITQPERPDRSVGAGRSVIEWVINRDTSIRINP